MSSLLRRPDQSKQEVTTDWQMETFWCMTIATFTISGFPPLAAFFSKDEILWKDWATGHPVLWLIGLIAAGMTSFYMFRLWFMTFFGDYRGSAACLGRL